MGQMKEGTDKKSPAEALKGLAAWMEGRMGRLKAGKGAGGKGRGRGKEKGGLKLLLILLLAAAVCLFLWKGFFAGKGKEGGKEQAQRTATVTRGSITSQLSSSGVISPKDTYSLTSLVEGEVIAADFEEGDQVTEGQVMYQIDVSSMESELKSAATSMERANRSYEQAAEDYEEARALYSGNTYKSTRSGFIKSLSVDVGDQISSNTQIASIYNDQTMKLKVPFLSGEAAQIGPGAQGTITLTDTGETLAGVVTAVSSLDEVLSGGRMVRYVTLETENPGGLSSNLWATVQIGGAVSAAEGSFEPVTDGAMAAEIKGNGSLKIEALLVNEGDYVTEGTPLFLLDSGDVEDLLQDFKDQVDMAQESVDSAQSKLDSTQESYDDYTITAPISGQVITKNVKVGDKISRSSNSETTLAVIYDLSELTFEMSVDELDVGDVKVGQKVQVMADALEGQVFSGTVTNVSLESSQSNGVTNYPVTVTLDDPGDLLPGMNVDGIIQLDQAEDVLMIPVDALMRGNRVYVRDEAAEKGEGGAPEGFRAVEVETGLISEDYVEIVSGLEEGQEVYVSETSGRGSAMIQMGGIPIGGPLVGGRPGGGGQRGGK